jgi:hypothetical protein
MIWMCPTQKTQDSNSVIAAKLRAGKVCAHRLGAIQVVIKAKDQSY